VAITRNGSANLGLDTNNAAYTCGSGANRILFVGMFGGAGASTPSITYNGVSMTSIAIDLASGDRRISLFYLLAPATGSNTVTVSFGSAPDHFQMYAADYDGVQQSGQPDASATNTSTGTVSLAAAVTVTAPNCWMIAMGREDAGGAVTWTTGTTNELQSGGTGGHFADSNGTVSTGSVSSTMTMGGANLRALIAASFQPDTGGGGDTQEWRGCTEDTGVRRRTPVSAMYRTIVEWLIAKWWRPTWQTC
jgi:hypothetical protein